MAKCGTCGSKKTMDAIMQSRVMQTKVESLEKPLQAGFVRVKYIGARLAPVSYYANGHPYQVANTPKYRFQDVPEKDASVLLSYDCFERVRIVPQVEIPKPIEPVKEVVPIVQEPVKIVAPMVTATAMQNAVTLMEQATGQAIQPKAETFELPTPSTVKPTEKKSYKSKRK